jgi:hypothetical protein
MAFTRVREVIEALYNQAGWSKTARIPDIMFRSVFK